MKIISKSLIITLVCCLICVGCEKESEKEMGTEGESGTEEESGTGEEGISVTPSAYTLIPDAHGCLELYGDSAASFKPGDVIFLRGKFENIWINDLKGSAEKPIVITNYPGEQVLNDVSVKEGTGTQENIKIGTIEEAKVNVNDFYQPLSGSPVGDAGYRNTVCTTLTGANLRIELV